MKNNNLLHLIFGFGSISFIVKALDYLLNIGLIYVFAPNDYGKLSLGMILIMLLIPFLGLSVEGAVSRYYYRFEGRDQKQFLGTAYTSVFIFNVILVIALMLFSKPLWQIVAPNLSFYPIIIICILTASLEYFKNFYIGIIRIKKDIKQYIRSNIIYSLLRFGFVIVSLLLFKTVPFLLLSLLIGVFVFLLLSYRKILKDIEICNLKKYRKLIFSYAILLLPVSILLVINNYADRFIISKHLGNNELGVYSAAMNIAMVITFTVNVFNMSVVPSFMEYYEKSKHNFASNMMRVYKFGFYIVYLGAILLSLTMLIIKSWIPLNYVKSISLIPFFAFIGVVSMLYVCTTNFMSLELNLMKQKIKVLALLVPINIGSNIFLIRYLGVMGSAISNLISTSLIVFFYMQILKKSTKIYLPSYLLLIVFVSVVLLYYLLKVIEDFSIWIHIGLWILVVILSLLFILKRRHWLNVK